MGTQYLFLLMGLAIVSIIMWVLIKICLDNRTVKSSYLLYALISSLLLFHVISFIESSLSFIVSLLILLSFQFDDKGSFNAYHYFSLFMDFLPLILNFCIIIFLGNLVINKGKININLLYFL